MNRHALAPLALAAGLIAPGAHASTLTVSDMLAADWAQTVVVDIGNATTTTAVATRSADPANSFWLTEFALPRSTAPGTSNDGFANVFQPFVWNPATDGAIDRFDFALEAVRLASSFASGEAGFVRPVVEQGGELYFVRGSALSTASLLQFSSLNWAFEDTADWINQSITSVPDFSATGGALRFGYRWELGTTCAGANGCAGASASAGIDNYRVTVTPQATTPPGTVPEPGSVALALAGLMAAWVLRRRPLA